MQLLVYLCLIMLTASSALAGAWLREEGSAFTAAAITVFKEPDYGYDYTTSFYAEWGARKNLTVGLDFEEGADYFGHATVFARVPVADLGAKGRFAAEFGIGAHHQYHRAWALYKTTLSYGKGFQNGWVAVDAALEYRTHDALYRKLDLTAGLSSDRLINPLLQVETAYRTGDPLYWRVRPSIMIKRKDRPTTWVLGVERNDARSDAGIKLSIWADF